MIQILQFLWIISLLIQSTSLLGEELHDLYIPTRPVGLGGAFTALANDQSSIWTNPGGISRIRKARSRATNHLVSFPNISVGANTEGISLYNKIQEINDISDETEKNTKLTELISSAGSKGKNSWINLSANPVYFFEPNRNSPIAVSFFSNTKLKISVEDVNKDTPSSSFQTIQSVADTGVSFGVGFSNFTNRLTYGLQMRAIQRQAYDDKLPLTTIIDNTALNSEIEKNGNTTQAVAFDFGFLWTVADFWFPTIGASIMNLPTGCQENYLNPFSEKRETICGTKYSGTVKNKDSLFLVDPTDARVGLSLTPRLTRGMALRIAFDLHHIPLKSGDNNYGLPEISTTKQIHGGLELFFGNPLKLTPLAVRVGVSQGFVTAGFTLRFWKIVLELAAYGKELASDESSQEDRRSSLAFSLEF